MVSVQKTNTSKRYYEVMFVPCGAENAELHHKITRARGGLILDDAGEDYHLIRLCREHHNVAHDTGSAFANGLLIHGYVITGVDGRPLYTGPDQYLTEHYGKAARV
jgi:hypothetical protein